MDAVEEKSEECSSGNDWGMNNHKVSRQQHDGLSSESSVSGNKVASPQNSITSSTFKEHDYIGMSEVSSADISSSQEERHVKDLHLQETELRLGPLGDPKSGASFQPKVANAKQALNLGFVEMDSQKVEPEGNNNRNPATKRVFADAIGESNIDRRSILSKLSGGNGLSDGQQLRVFSQLSKHPLLPPLYPWKKQQPNLEDSNVEVKTSSDTRAPVVGWPPVQSFRKNSLAAPNPKKQPEAKGCPIVSPQASIIPSIFVKVYMDGVSIGRKVDIKSHDSYEKLSVTLEEMFQHQFDGPCPGQSHKSDKKLNFLSGSDYVLTYEDKDGDLMLVGDVPWNMFSGTVKRLRIMKGSDAIGLAPRVSASV